MVCLLARLLARGAAVEAGGGVGGCLAFPGVTVPFGNFRATSCFHQPHVLGQVDLRRQRSQSSPTLFIHSANCL